MLLGCVRLAGVAAIPVLIRALGSVRLDEARWAGTLLVALGGPRVIDRLTHLLDDLSASESSRTIALDLLAQLQSSDTDIAALRARGLDLVDSGDYAAARPLLDRVVALAPDDAEALSFLGVCSIETGSPEHALPFLERAVRLEPRWALHYWNLAAAAWASDQLCRAYVSLQRYLALADTLDGAEERRGEAREFIDEYEVTIRSSHPEADLDTLLAAERLFGRALGALDDGRHGEAIEGFERVLALVPSHFPSWGNLGAAYLALERTEEADLCLRRALDLHPGYDVALTNLRHLETL